MSQLGAVERDAGAASRPLLTKQGSSKRADDYLSFSPCPVFFPTTTTSFVARCRLVLLSSLLLSYSPSLWGPSSIVHSSLSLLLLLSCRRRFSHPRRLTGSSRTFTKSTLTSRASSRPTWASSSTKVRLALSLRGKGESNATGSTLVCACVYSSISETGPY